MAGMTEQIYDHLIAQRFYLETARDAALKSLQHAMWGLALLDVRIAEVEKELEAKHGKPKD